MNKLFCYSFQPATWDKIDGHGGFLRLTQAESGIILKQRWAKGERGHTANKQAQNADATVTLTRAAFNEVILGGKAALEAKVAAGDIKVEGNREKLGELFSLLDKFDPWFNIVTP